MNDRAEVSFEAHKLLRRALRTSFFVVGLYISAIGFFENGLFLFLGIIFAALIFAAGFSGLPDKIIGFVARRRGELYMRVFALLMPLLSTAVSLVMPYFLWVILRAGIPLLWNQMVPILIFLFAALISLGVFFSNTFELISGRTNA